MSQLDITNRYVAFLDILGFKSLIRKIKTPNSRVVPLVRRIIESIHRKRRSTPLEQVFAEEDEQVRVDFEFSALEKTAFSDSVVISVPETAAESAWLIIDEASRIAIELLSLGSLCRGGIALGLMHHQDDVLFGQAGLDAYHLESQCAIYPRIILSPEVAENAKSSSFYKYLYIETDIDGISFVNIFHRVIVEKDAGIERQIRSKVQDNTASSRDLSRIRHWSKWKWAQRKLDEACS